MVAMVMVVVVLMVVVSLHQLPDVKTIWVRLWNDFEMTINRGLIAPALTDKPSHLTSARSRSHADTPWSRTAKNPDKSNGPLSLLFACWLVWGSTVNEWLFLLCFFSVLDHSATEGFLARARGYRSLLDGCVRKLSSWMCWHEAYNWLGFSIDHQDRHDRR